MRFDIISIFPESFKSYFGASILKRAVQDGLVTIEVHQLRQFTHDKHQTTDDTPYGGGPGMVMKVEPIDEAVQTLEARDKISKTRTLLLSAKGKIFTEQDAQRLVEYDRLILVCGRYEGVDERVVTHVVDEEISIGAYVLTGGELPAMVLVDSIARLVPGVLGNSESAHSESYTDGKSLEYPQYTKPESYRGWDVPPVLLSGNHVEIAAWRASEAKKMTEKNSSFSYVG